jgi:hypothetical protein
MHEVTSTPVTTAQMNKHKKYAALTHLMQLQKMARQRQLIPVFKAPVVSHLGEYSTDLLEAINWLAPQAYRHYSTTRTEQPLPPKVMTARYRRDILNSMAVASAKGCALLLLAGGNPL